MNLNPADVLNPVFNALDALISELRRLSLPRVRLAVPGSDCLGVGRRLAAETVTGKLRHGHSWHHFYDATAESITAANHHHR